MAATVVIMISFQSLRGYVYYQLSVLVASAMVGLALGGAMGHYTLRRGCGIERLLVLDQMALVFVLILLSAVFHSGAMHSLGPYAFAGIVLAISFLGGFQFPLLAGTLFSREARGGVLYALDLAGASIGAIGVSLVVIPTIGLPGSWTMLSMVGALALAMLAVSSRLSSPPSRTTA
jgi:hypothetical protein